VLEILQAHMIHYLMHTEYFLHLECFCTKTATRECSFIYLFLFVIECIVTEIGHDKR